MHRHHIIPRHMGGDDSEDNLTPPISVALHAEFHRLLWLDFGRSEDFIAWKALAGRITPEEARLMAAKAGQDKSDTYRASRPFAAAAMLNSVTSETCSRGGKAANSKLLEWQRENRDAFLRQCAENGRRKTPKQHIPHEYLGDRYESKKALQAAHGMSICGFYGKLRRGEIKRLDREIANQEKTDGPAART